MKILNTNIATGDDCVSLGDGCKNITVQNVNCGPGHGISVGSLGKYDSEEPVAGFLVKNCTLNGTDNGVRIKTWPNTPGAITITDMHFEDLTMNNVTNPIIIDHTSLFTPDTYSLNIALPCNTSSPRVRYSVLTILCYLCDPVHLPRPNKFLAPLLGNFFLFGKLV